MILPLLVRRDTGRARFFISSLLGVLFSEASQPQVPGNRMHV